MQGTPEAGNNRNALWALADELLKDKRLILASNRGPMEHHVAPNGDLQPRRGSGGVVTALSGLTRHVDFTWIASAMGEGDRRAAEASGGKAVPSPLPGQKVAVRFVTTPRRAYHKYYNVICNPLLWFIQHYMWSSPYTPRVDSAVYDAWENGYVYVNRQFAGAIVEEAAESPLRPLVMVHDYQLYLVPKMVREQLPHAPHPPVRPHPVGDLQLLGAPARYDPHRHLRKPLQRRHRRIPDPARRAGLPRQLRLLPRRR